ncbi:MAG: hypothetical protein ABEJ40_02610, partial [Haloarculaceae archaeon]
MTTPREKYERRLDTFNEYVESGEIDENTASRVRELLNAYDDHNVGTPMKISQVNLSTLTII